ncbi:MAG: hypothetical protein VX529_10995 [Pseudomonadota bacterium]|nr:hypothetical protein [Pseudomonadota bacterium]
MTVRIPPDAPVWAQALVRQLRQLFAAIDNPQRPVRVPVFANAAALPPAGQWEDCIVRVSDVGSSTPGMAYSDGTNWRRLDTNATL